MGTFLAKCRLIDVTFIESMEKKDYTAFKALDFAKDPDFIGWLLMPDQGNCRFWEDFILKYPELKPEIDRARTILLSVKFNPSTLSLPEQQGQIQQIRLRAAKHKKRLFIYRAGSVAAACILGIILLFAHSLQKNENPSDTIAKINEVQLLMGDKRVEIPIGANIACLADGNIELTKSTHRISLFKGNNNTNRLIVPKGRRTVLQLPDGTKIWVNSGSEITFPSTFATDKRVINMLGEAYIEVTKDHKHPFIVKCPDFNVRVLGTKFDVHAYKGDKAQRVILAEGSVQIDTSSKGSLKLSPNEMGTITDNELICTAVDASHYTSWKDGYLYLQSEPLSEVLKHIERYYNVEISCCPGSCNLKCNGKLVLTDSINDVINCIVSTMPVTAKKKGNKIEIKLTDNKSMK